MSKNQSLSLDEMAERVMESSRQTGFALMKANYVERSAPEMLGGKIKGPPPQARDIAVQIRDSIWPRFGSLRFHYSLLERVHEGHLSALYGAESGSRDEFDVLWDAAWNEQFLFDDLVFNAASFFDYLASAIWFGFHGQNHIKKNWGDATSAARNPEREPESKNGPSIYDSRTGEKILNADRHFVGDLYGYRADLIHHKSDAGAASSGFRLDAGQLTSELSVTLPGNYAKEVKALVPDPGGTDKEPELLDAAEHLILNVGAVGLDLMATLQSELDWEEGDTLTFLS